METIRTLLLQELKNNCVIRLGSDNNKIDFSKSEIGVGVYFDDAVTPDYRFFTNLYADDKDESKILYLEIRIPKNKKNAKIVLTSSEDYLSLINACVLDFQPV
jgi:hypothetical protein